MSDVVTWALEGEVESSPYMERNPVAAARAAHDQIRGITEDPIITVGMPDGSLHEIDLSLDEDWCLTHGADCEHGA